MEEKFSAILNSGERINKVIKPNRLSYIGYWLVYQLMIYVPILIVFLIILLKTTSNNGGKSESVLIVEIMGGFMLLALIVTWIVMSLLYRNTYYAITNKRLIIRTGIFGIDYKSMDLSDVNAIEPKVSVWDKIIRKRTGSILLGSPTRPIISTQQNTMGGGTFKFSSIANPYDLSKELKELVDESKHGEKNTKPSGSKSMLDQIKELDELRKSGAITDKEYKKMKDKIMQDL